MAATSLRAPGTEFGPCEDACCHVDCASTRGMAAALCVYCGREIGYETRFYIEGGLAKTGASFSHMTCAMDAQERK